MLDRLALGLVMAAVLSVGARAQPAADTDRCKASPFAADQYFPTPAFPNQTRAPAPAPGAPFDLQVLATGLEHPWKIAFLPDGRMLVSERAGRLRIVGQDGALSEPIAGLPPLMTAAGEGLHDVTLDPDFAHNRLIYFSYFAPPPGKPARAAPLQEWLDWLKLSPADRETHKVGIEMVARARLSDDGRSLQAVKVILQGANRRIVFAPDGSLFVTSATPAGANIDTDDTPQRLANPYGKVLRIMPDGSIPKDNPWAGKPGARSEIYAIGFRDPEGAAINPATGELWTVEHGPRGGDELNRVRAGLNYGFNVISYGREYTTKPVSGGITAKEGLEQPIYFWTPSIAPSGLLFYTGELFPQWKGDVFVGAQAGKHLVRLVLKDDKVVAEESLLADRCRRIRDVRQGPEGALYLLTEEQDGEIWRLTPKR